jgi:hypothetical protein
LLNHNPFKAEQINKAPSRDHLSELLELIKQKPPFWYHSSAKNEIASLGEYGGNFFVLNDRGPFYIFQPRKRLMKSLVHKKATEINQEIN